MKVALDSNLLIYTLDDSDRERRRRAITILELCMSRDLILPNQVIGEVMAVIARKRPDRLQEAVALVAQLTNLFPAIVTETRHLLTAADLARRWKLQYWDAVIWHVAAEEGARWFLSEDMHDGLTIGGLTLIDPFNRDNDDRLAQLFAS